MKLVSSAILSLLCLALPGCASYSEHQGFSMTTTGGSSRTGMVSPVFPGTVQGVSGVAYCLSSPVWCWFVKDPDWLEVGVSSLYIIDLAPSLVLDVLYLPGDVIYWIKGP